jgi:L-serine dehydratase
VGDDAGELELVGISIGGGKIEIIELNGFKLRLSGHNPAILVVHDDRFGAIANVSNILAKHQINIGQMEVSRKEKGQVALMTIEVDVNLEEDVIDEISALPNITKVARIVD